MGNPCDVQELNEERLVALAKDQEAIAVDPSSAKTRKRYYYMDALNVIACFAVIVLHCSEGAFFNEGGPFWRYCVAAQSVFMFAVPIFFMISGANLLGYRSRYSTREFFKKRFGRVLSVFVGCSVLLYVLQCFPIEILGCGWRQPSLRDFFVSLIANGVDQIYWFFYAIIGLYLVTPIFSKIADDKTLLGYAIVICAITSIVFPLVERYQGGYDLFSFFAYPYLSSWLLYYLLGYYLNTHLERRVSFVILVLVMVCSVAFMFGMTVHTNDVAREFAGEAVKYDSFYANAMSLPGLTLSSALFVVGRQLNGPIGKLKCYPLIKEMSALSLGIYAIHMEVLIAIERCMGDGVKDSVFLRSIAIYLITALIVWLYRVVKKRVKAAVRPE